MNTVCEMDQCAGCMACIDICPKNAIKIVDSLKSYNAVIDESKCINCHACHQVCQNNILPECKNPAQWKQGWAENKKIREKCSSGGLATAIASSFIEHGGIVWGCVFRNGEFKFESAEKICELEKFVGSKYVKSNPAGVYKSIKSLLKTGKKNLFIGLPCQVAALKRYVGKNLEDKLYTIDLICHGTPSPHVLEIFLNQYNQSLKDLTDIRFRSKAKFMLYGNYKGIITNGVSDKYSIAFLNSLTYTENCYNCKYAQEKRVSDLTLGDSWGTALSIQEQKNGVSLILCQTSKGVEMLNSSDIHLEDVDIKNAVENNHQLKHPSIKPKGRTDFFSNLNKISFNKLVFKNFPRLCLKQDLKEFLIKIRIIRGGILNYEIYTVNNIKRK